MTDIVGYSSYTHEKQQPFLIKAYRAKSEIVEEAQRNNDYGSGLKTLLIFYNFEAQPNEFEGTDLLERKYDIRRYNSKEKSLRVNFYIGYNELTDKPCEEQIEFYYRSTMQALAMVKEKFTKRRNTEVNIDFEKLENDIRQGFINRYPSLKNI